MNQIDQTIIDDAKTAGFELTDDINYYAVNLEQLAKFAELTIERQRSNGEAVYQIKQYDDNKWIDVFDQYAYNNLPSIDKRILFTATQHSPIPQAFMGMPLLNADEIALLHRFIETTEDDSSYDLSAEEVQRLAKYGALRHNGGGHYSITEFGHWLSAAPSAPIEAQQSYADGLKAAAKLLNDALTWSYVGKVMPASNHESLRTSIKQLRALIPSTQAPDEVK